MQDDARARFAALVREGAEPPLDEACLLIAAHAHPERRLSEELHRLDRLAEGVRAPTLDALRHHLFVVEGFAGDRGSYGDAANSLLPSVLDRRRGIPITLAVVAMEVGRRCGVALEGVGMPGHFLVRQAGDADQLIDVFDAGRPLDPPGARRIFEQLAPRLAWDPSFLEPVTATAILARILANLAAAHRRSSDRAGLCWALGLRSLLPGATDRERRELAVVLGASGRFAEAAETFESLGGERDLRAAQRLRARLN